jgi:hypothetical protein
MDNNLAFSSASSFIDAIRSSLAFFSSSVSGGGTNTVDFLGFKIPFFALGETGAGGAVPGAKCTSDLGLVGGDEGD